MPKISVVQDFPVFFDKKRTVQKMLDLINDCASRDSELIVFPESFIPGYPRGFDFGAKVGSRTSKGRKLFRAYYNESILRDGEEMNAIIDAAKEAKIFVVFGFTERTENNKSLYCSVAYVSPGHGLLGVHRKIKPTGTERLIWAESEGDDLHCFNTRIGKIGGLICWENYMPLARMAMYQQGIEIYIAPTADSRENWTSTMKHIALEGRCFVIGCNQYFNHSILPKTYRSLIQNEEEVKCPGGSVIVSPLGEIIAGPLFNESGILEVEIDLEEIKDASLDFDPNGHYNRPDIFKFEVLKK